MAWARVDDGWWCHPKVMGLPLAARGLWVTALSWSCQMRIAVVPVTFLGMVGGTEDDARVLLEAGLWDLVDGGYEIHDWAEYQDRSLAEKRAEAGRKGGLSRANASKSQANVKQTSSKSQAPAKQEAKQGPFPSLPVPTNTTTSPTCEELPDEQTVRRVAVLVGRRIAAHDRPDDDGRYAAGVTKRILTEFDGQGVDRQRIVDALTAGQDPETIAAGWEPGDALAGALYPSGDRPQRERHGPAMPEFRPLPVEAVHPDFGALRTTLATGEAS